MDTIYELNPVYTSLCSTIGENMGKNICLKITQLFQSELEMKVSLEAEEYERAAMYRDENKNVAKKIISLLEEKYLHAPIFPIKTKSTMH